MVKKIALLGASGSIGSSTFEVIREQADHFKISLASAHSSWEKLCNLAGEFDIPVLVFTGIDEPSLQEQIRSLHPKKRIYFGEDELINLLKDEDYDIALNAIGGSAGIRATFAILGRGKSLALANKESLVLGGHLVHESFKDALILPVDSEHSAIFQAIGNSPKAEIKKLIITASGGAFRDFPLSDFGTITPEMALKHPNWDMGAKVTLDSATMFNKALEVMEARWLFDLPYEQIEAVIHPQSVIHSLVQYIDGSLIAQLGTPDMKLPILYALSYPKRLPSELVQTDLLEHANLTFEGIAKERYPLYYLGLDAARAGGIIPTIINAAVEAAMKLFLGRIITFSEIHKVVEESLQKASQIAFPSLEEIITINRNTYKQILSQYKFID
ncbi:MAG TPA: 1-deoxy-D-xylulose-5-phosphate reductoisomerase [Candidatus Cloacimonetes bacterium]|nr:1-deoxy-D-xylulose-5-phosphate reductoisomerase [Candidatus Cloacimonadota bacterium]